MTQYFDDVKVSDKGMVKLIRNNGKDYIFPAVNITEICKVREEPGDNLYDIVGVFFNATRGPSYTLAIKTKTECLYVNVPYTEELAERLNDAHTVSERIARSKYGTFS